MNGSRYYPFERNRYFYGKLLTVRDFESEQRYVGDKRRLMNRLLFGTGVVSGLQVLQVDDKSVSVQAGVALDDLGREVVVPSPVTLKLSMVEGFTNNDYAKDVYLSVVYDERGKEPVHAVANSAAREGELSEYNRVLESYRLVIDEQAPQLDSFSHLTQFYNLATVYDNGKVRIHQLAPKYVNPASSFVVKLRIERTMQTPPLSFEFQPSTTGLEVLNEDAGRIVFSEPLHDRDTEYEVSIECRAGLVSEAGRIGGKAETAILTVGEEKVVLDADWNTSVQLIDDPVFERLQKDYFDRSLDDALKTSGSHGVCLAKISLVQVGPTYIIERVRPVPFGEYVLAGHLVQGLRDTVVAPKPQDAIAAQSSSSTPPAAVQNPTPMASQNQTQSTPDGQESALDSTGTTGGQRPFGVPADEIVTGIEEFDLTPRLGRMTLSKLGRAYFSDEIQHGLGPGPVAVHVAIEEVADTDGFSEDKTERAFFGTIDIFRESPYAPKVLNAVTGVVAFPQKGTFVVGLRVSNLTDQTMVKVRWWAWRTDADAKTGTRTEMSANLKAQMEAMVGEVPATVALASDEAAAAKESKEPKKEPKEK